jgi:hypothetical protein
VVWGTGSPAESPKELEYGVECPSMLELWSPKESEYEVVHPPSPDSGSPKKSISLDVEEPIVEPDNGWLWVTAKPSVDGSQPAVRPSGVEHGEASASRSS